MLVSVLLDESGSMMSVRGETMSALNAHAKGLKNVNYMLTTFNSLGVKRRVEPAKVEEVVEFKSFEPAGYTPLYDAIGATVQATKDAAKFFDEPVLFVIVTDGYENASKELTSEDVRVLLGKVQEDGWTVVYLGADQDAFTVTARLGVAAGNTMSFRSGAIRETMHQHTLFVNAWADTGGKRTSTYFEDDE